MKRTILALAATAAMSLPAFAQTAALTTSCSDYMALSSDEQLAAANQFNEDLTIAQAQELGETQGDKDADNRMRNIMAACENRGASTVFQAVKEQNTGDT